jgi:hypothetical protein
MSRERPHQPSIDSGGGGGGVGLLLGEGQGQDAASRLGCSGKVVPQHVLELKWGKGEGKGKW